MDFEISKCGRQLSIDWRVTKPTQVPHEQQSQSFRVGGDESFWLEFKISPCEFRKINNLTLHCIA